MVDIPRQKSRKYSLILNAEAPGVHGIIETVDNKPINIVALLLDNTENSLALEIKRWLDESREKMILDIQQISEDVINFSIRTVDEELRTKQTDLNRKKFFNTPTLIDKEEFETNGKLLQGLFYEPPDFPDNPISMEEAVKAIKEIAKKYSEEDSSN